MQVGELPIQLDPSVQTIWVDSMNLQAYEESKTTTLYFHTAILFPPELMRRQEVARLHMTVGQACKIVDLMARHFNHYPTKADKSEEGDGDRKEQTPQQPSSGGGG